MKRRYDQWIGATPPETPWADSLLQGLGLASKVYRSGVRFRTWAYRRGVFRRFALGVPVVSVGNVTAGGTGKTPLVMHLAERLQADGARVVILSRGYIRQGKGVIVVSDGDRVLARKRRAGDEPYLMGIRLPKVPIIVGSNRLEAGMVAARRFDPDVVLVDDGFQHLRLHRDWDIVAVDAVNPFGNDRLLPRGTLREPAAHIRRAQLVCLTHTDMAPDLDDVVAQIDHLAPLCPIVQSRHVVSSVYRHPDRSEVNVVDIAGQKLFALSGIGNPLGFERTVESLGAEVADRRRFADHYRFTRSVLDEVVDAAHRAGADAIVTTEKDMVRFPPGFAFGIEVLVVAIELQITGGGEHIDNIVKTVEQRRQKVADEFGVSGA